MYLLAWRRTEHLISNIYALTTRRQFKFSQEGFDMARSAPIVHQPTLKIGIEGQREFKLSNNEDFPAYNVRCGTIV